MATLHLDFQSERRPPAMAGWLSLIVGVALLGGLVGWNVLDQQPRLQAMEGKLQWLDKSVVASQPTAVNVTADELAAEWQRAAKVAERLATPWQPLFAVLEGSADRPIALLSLEPDADRQELVLTGEARDFDVLMNYFRQLQEQPLLSEVVLQTHQINRQDHDKPVRFRIAAHWAKTS
jgi:Tfp pilus assembly protein PilN